jgi:hypothetical protein
MLKISRTIRVFAYILLISVLLQSCGDNKHQVNTGDIEVNIKIKRYEDRIFSVRDVNDFEQMYQGDTLFFKFYLNNIIGDVTGGRAITDKSLKTKGLVEFIKFKDMQDLYSVVKEKYEDVSDIEEDLSKAFTYYRFHFKDKPIPEVVTFISPFRSGIAIFEDKIGIGLDLFLGVDFEPYQTPALGFANYMIQKYKREQIVPNVIKSWMLTEFDPVKGKTRFLDKIIYEGKLLYTLDALLPNTPDSLKIGYTAGQLEWNEQNEFQIFDHVNSNDLLFTSNERSFVGLLQDGPFSKGNGIPQDSSPRIGAWLGWQMVRAYMTENPKTTLLQLWGKDDADKILRESRYKP